jgi:hypothetical protein
LLGLVRPFDIYIYIHVLFCHRKPLPLVERHRVRPAVE